MKTGQIKLRDFIYNILGTFDKALSRNAQHIVVCYHSIAQDGERFSIDEEVFKQQLNLLLKTRKNISVNELEQIVNGVVQTKQKTFLLTFDDGYKNLLTLREFVKEKSLKPLIFILPFDSKPDFSELGLKFDRLSADDVKMLLSEGWNVGSHSFTHLDLAVQNSAEQKHEIIDSKDSLERDLNTPIEYFAYPKGRYNKDCEKFVKETGYKMVFTMNDGKISKGTNKLRIPRIGVDRSHSVNAFSNTIRPSNILFRKIVKSLGISGI